MLAISCYVSYCEAFLGCPPNFPLWLSLYFGKALPAKGEDSGDIQATGGVVFSACPDISDTFLPIELKKKVTKWKESWFYLQNPTANVGVDLLPFSLERSHPRNLKALPRDEDAEEVAELMKRGQLLRRQGLTAANLYTCWLSRRISPLNIAHTCCVRTLGTTTPAATTPRTWTSTACSSSCRRIRRSSR